MRWFELYIALAWVLRFAMVPVILRRQLAPGASIAWLGIIFLHPYIGGLLYLLFGETRLGPHRVQRHKEIVSLFRSAPRNPSPPAGDVVASATTPPLPQSTVLSTQHFSCRHLPARYDPIVLQAEKISGLPVLPDNQFHLLTSADDFTRSLAADIDAARSHVHLLYYIFACDPTARTVTDALKRAAARGVTCRVLADAVASRPFFHRRHGLANDLRVAGVQVAAALPAHVIRRRFARMDLRNHRKLAVIDDAVGYVGSHNLIHPSYGGKPGGPWVDASARLTGPVVSELAGVFAEDWAFETEQMLPLPRSTAEASAGQRSSDYSSAVPHSSQLGTGNLELGASTPMQVVPTGPTEPGATYRRVLLAAVQCARARLTLTTPYFVPDEPTLVSLAMAADRGVAVTLILPAVSDNRLTQAAGRAHFDRLLAAGVRIHLYRPGLIHTKSVTVDDTLAVFGSANLDVRSFNLNFELSVLFYSPDATQRLRALQDSYLADSCPLDPATWPGRPPIHRYADSAISLLSPLL